MTGRVRARIALSLALVATACHKPERRYERPEGAAPVPSSSSVVEVEARTPLLVTFPCSRCHRDRAPNPEKRLLVKFHVVRNKEFHHGDPKAWCYNCHSQADIDRLVTSSGALVTFDEAYLLCGGCHGDKLRDWKLQVHGKTMGHWRGTKLRRSCTGCHNPHRPAFQPLEPEPPPIPPERTTTAFMGGNLR